MRATFEKAVVSFALLAVTIPVFFAAGAMTATHVPATWLATRWDARIPLVPAAVWFYLSWYVAPWLLLVAPSRDFRRVASSIALAFATCTVAYVLIPASIERPAVAGGSLSENALLFLYRLDPPWNIFPSFHAALCAILWRPVFGGKVARRILPIWMATICVACVLTKQHQILDIVAGILVGIVALLVVTAVSKVLDRADASRTTNGASSKTCLPGSMDSPPTTNRCPDCSNVGH